MFHARRALTVTNAARHVEAEYRQGDYYTRGDSTAPARWLGRAAADLALHGDIRPDDFTAFTALLEGRAPDGTPLAQAQQLTRRRRAGWDFTLLGRQGRQHRGPRVRGRTSDSRRTKPRSGGR